MFRFHASGLFGLTAALMLTAAMPSFAGPVQIIRNRPDGGPQVEQTTAYPLHHFNQRRLTLHVPPIVSPEATVDRALSEQPVRPHLYQVRLVGSVVYIDPQANYLRQGTFRIDERHFLLQAQRLAQSLQTKPARVIRGDDSEENITGQVITPRMIIIKPEGQLPQFKGPMPTVPVAPKSGHPSMARAD